jgi:hypothetical protein
MSGPRKEAEYDVNAVWRAWMDRHGGLPSNWRDRYNPSEQSQGSTKKKRELLFAATRALRFKAVRVLACDLNPETHSRIMGYRDFTRSDFRSLAGNERTLHS